MENYKNIIAEYLFDCNARMLDEYHSYECLYYSKSCDPKQDFVESQAVQPEDLTVIGHNG